MADIVDLKYMDCYHYYTTLLSLTTNFAGEKERKN